MPTPFEESFQQVELPSNDFIQELRIESATKTDLIYTFPQRLAACFRTAAEDAAPSLLDFGSATRETAFAGYTSLRNQVA